jgi:hypothetical protein
LFSFCEKNNFDELLKNVLFPEKNNEEKYLRGYLSHEILEIDNNEILNLLTSNEVFERILLSFKSPLESVFCTYIQLLLKKCLNQNQYYVWICIFMCEYII